MSEEVLINVGLGETRIAVVEDGVPTDLVLERTSEEDLTAKTGRAGHSLLGNIFLGRVQRVLPGMQAAFVDIGLERAGFLGAREAKCLCELMAKDEETLPPISQCVHEGQAILVQAVKDPIADKGARLSANVTLAGRQLVMVPNQSGVALSRRIENEEDRARLTTMVEGIIEKLGTHGVTGAPAGYIVRTAALEATESELIEDARRLAAQWEKVREVQKLTKPPAVVYHDLDPVAKTMRDYAGLDTKRVIIDDLDAYNEAKAYCAATMPAMLDRIHLHNGPGALFDMYDIDGEIERALETRVELPSGGWIIIENTEALTAVDVNSGRFTAATGLEETSVKTNLEAAHMLVKQLRLRGTGGLIVIDFIHMNEPENNQKIVDALNEGFESDRVPTQISGMSEFGLIEMTRKRVREPLDKLLTEVANPGTPVRIKTRGTVANELMRAVEKEACAGRPLVVRASPDVEHWFRARNAFLLERIRQRLPVRVVLEADPSLTRERFTIGYLK